MNRIIAVCVVALLALLAASPKAQTWVMPPSELGRAPGGPATTGEVGHVRCQLELVSTPGGTL
jgi:hypothetical protein